MHSLPVSRVLAQGPIAECRAVLAIADEPVKCLTVASLACIMSNLVRKRRTEKRILEFRIEIAREAEMHSAPFGRKDGEFGVTLLEHHPATVGVRAGLAVLDVQRW